jgi:simple sugar transport system permease protein
MSWIRRGRARLLARLLHPSRPGSNLLITLGAIAASLFAGALTVTIIGVSPIQAFLVIIDGSVGSVRGLSDSLVFATPRLFVALGAIVAVRCGVFNLGGEGQLQLGAIGAVLAGTMLGQIFAPLHIAFAVLAAMAFGAVWAMLAILLKLWRGADEIIVTLMMNFIGIYLVAYLVEGPLQPPDSIFNISERIEKTASFPILIPGTRLHLGFVIAIVATVLVWCLLYRTSLGLKLRATGLNLQAARLQGLSTGRLIFVSMAISGSIGGLAGAAEVLGVQFRLIEGFSAGFGFEGLAIAFLGGLEPVPVLLIAIYFGIIQNGTTELQSTMSIPASLVHIMVALPILFLAGAQGWRYLRRSG